MLKTFYIACIVLGDVVTLRPFDVMCDVNYPIMQCNIDVKRCIIVLARKKRNKHVNTRITANDLAGYLLCNGRKQNDIDSFSLLWVRIEICSQFVGQS